MIHRSHVRLVVFAAVLCGIGTAVAHPENECGSACDRRCPAACTDSCAQSAGDKVKLSELQCKMQLVACQAAQASCESEKAACKMAQLLNAHAEAIKEISSHP